MLGRGSQAISVTSVDTGIIAVAATLAGAEHRLEEDLKHAIRDRVAGISLQRREDRGLKKAGGSSHEIDFEAKAAVQSYILHCWSRHC